MKSAIRLGRVVVPLLLHETEFNAPFFMAFERLTAPAVLTAFAVRSSRRYRVVHDSR